MNKTKKIALLSYFIATIILFVYLATPYRSGLGMLIFTALQILACFFLFSNKEALFLSFPLLAFSLNCFISTNTMWRFSNAFASILIVSAMALVNSKSFTPGRIISRLFEPCVHSKELKEMLPERSEENSKKTKSLLLGLLIALPFLFVIIPLLISADLVLQNMFANISFEWFVANIYKLILGLAVGLYLFGVIISGHKKREETKEDTINWTKRLSYITINTLLSCLLIVYVAFIIVQIKYLLLQGSLPEEFTYAEYARRGFFELLFLSILNTIILVCITRKNIVKSTKIFAMLFCVSTMCLAFASYYRMQLYIDSYGLSRLRLLVITFLSFEFIGLLLTSYYILKKKFNIITCYLIIMLSFYSFVNVLPIDYIIAKNQVGRMVTSNVDGIAYITQVLSADAYSQVEQIKDKYPEEFKAYVHNIARTAYKENRLGKAPWQSFNFTWNKVIPKLYNEDPEEIERLKNIEKNGGYVVTGTTVEKIKERFPEITGIESCKWTYKDARPNESFFNIILDPYYTFYGEIVLTEDFYNKIIADYEWEELNRDDEFIEEEYDIFNYIKITNKAYFSNADITSSSELLLDKSTRTLYFYQEY